MGIENTRIESAMDDPSRFGGKAAASEAENEKPANPLDSPEKLKLLNKLRDWETQERERQAANRYQMALDEDYYDSMQWTEEEAQELMDRGQAPLVFNEIAPTIDWLSGTERRMRIDNKVLARRKEPRAEQDAENKTSLLKYLSDINNTPYVRSDAFKMSIIAGLAWIEVGIKGDPTEEPLYERVENWRNCLYDSNSVERDYSDGRYFFRHRWLDDDVASVYFHERKSLIEQSVQNGTSLVDPDDDEIWYMGARVTEPGHDYAGARTGKYRQYDGGVYSWSRRSRVKLTECWYKAPVLKRKFMSGAFENEVFDSNNPEHVQALQGGYSVYDKIEMEIRCAIYCNAGLLWEGKSPYNHGKIPFIPVWCYRRKRDNAPYGKVRSLRDPQDDLNKRHSKALFILSTKQVTMDNDALEFEGAMTIDELQEEVARPDSFIVKKKGSTLEIDRDIQLAEEHLMMMDRDVMHIRNTGGANSENLGRTTNVTSGVALQERKEAGTVQNTEIFDNLRLVDKLLGEMKISNIEQFYTDEKIIRIAGERGAVKYIHLNKPDGQGGYLNDIAEFHADYVVSEQEYRASLLQAMFESLFDILGRIAQVAPQAALNLLDVVIDIAPGIPSKQEVVNRIRQINGQRDPGKEQTPEELQAEQDAKQLQAEQQRIALETLQENLNKLKAENTKIKSDSIEKIVKSMFAALQAGQVVAAVPGSAQVADELLKGAGFESNVATNSIDAVNTAADAFASSDQIPVLNNGMPPTGMAGANAGINTVENDSVRL